MLDRLQLGEALLAGTALNDETLQRAFQRREESGQSLYEVLLDMNALPEEQLLGALGALYSIPLRESLDADDVDVERVRTLATRLTRRRCGPVA